MPLAGSRETAGGFDPRVTPARGDLAALHLRGIVPAERYVAGTAMRVAAPWTPLRSRPDAAAAQDSELRFGEGFTVYEFAGAWSWGQSDFDAYVGWVASAALAPAGAPATHRVATRFAQAYDAPDYKRIARTTLPLAARVTVVNGDPRWLRLDDGSWLPAAQLAPIDAATADPVETALGLVGVPYVWGGRTPAGIDCSGLVQLAHELAGTALPRDSDQQRAATMAHALDPGSPPRRGDLVFFPGHVALALDAHSVVHANALAMAVTVEPLDALCARIARDAGPGPGPSPITGIHPPFPKG